MPDSITRRGFSAILAGAASRLDAQVFCQNIPSGPAQPFVVEPGIQNIQRKPLSAILSNPQELSRLRLAYKRLRDLTTSDQADPRGYMQQANVHCFRCGGQTGPASPPQSDIHRTWSFLPWHRAYLYYHERILCELLNDPTFRLPYWDWDVLANRNLPPMHRDAQAAGQPNSLFNALRDVNGGQPMPPFIFPQNNNPMNSPNFTAFGGTSSSGGGIELSTHGLIHVWTADRLVSAGRQDMGLLTTAARDPVFYSHHCQIDRLWAEWNRRDTINHRNPTSSSWLNRAFTFFDHKKVRRAIKVSDVLDTASRLGFSYAPGAALAAPGPPKRFNVSYQKATRRLGISSELKNRIVGSGALNATWLLVLDRAVIPHNPGLYFVFAGDPPGNNPTAAPNYLGYIAEVRGEHAHGEGRMQLMLEATSDFAQRAGAAGGVVLSVAHATASGAGAATPLVYENVYLVER